MRIAILTDYYYPQLGGITEHVHGQATNLSARGHEVTVITGHLFRPPSVTDGDPAPVARDAPFEMHPDGPGAAPVRQRVADAAHASTSG